jgi:hypothetical protein
MRFWKVEHGLAPGADQRFLAPGARERHDVVEEAHVEHAVRLVEHPRVQRGQRQALAPDPIEQPHRRSAAQREDLDVLLRARGAPQLRGHRLGELARRAQHEGLHAQVMTRQSERQARRIDVLRVRSPGWVRHEAGR